MPAFRFPALLLAACLAAACLAACSKSQPTQSDPIDNTPGIHSFSPTSGPRGTIVTIKGAGFKVDSIPVLVTFGIFNARVLSVTDNEIKAQVPPEIQLGPTNINIGISGKAQGIDKLFTVTFSPTGVSKASIDMENISTVYGDAKSSYPKVLKWTESSRCLGTDQCVNGDTITFKNTMSSVGFEIRNSVDEFSGVIDVAARRFRTIYFHAGSSTQSSHGEGASAASTYIRLHDMPYTEQNGKLEIHISGSDIANYLTELYDHSSEVQGSGPVTSTGIISLDPFTASSSISITLE